MRVIAFIPEASARVNVRSEAGAPPAFVIIRVIGRLVASQEMMPILGFIQ